MGGSCTPRIPNFPWLLSLLGMRVTKTCCKLSFPNDSFCSYSWWSWSLAFQHKLKISCLWWYKYKVHFGSLITNNQENINWCYYKLHNVIFNYPFWRRCPSRTHSIFPRLEQGPCSVERYTLSTSSITDRYFHIHTLCKWNLLGSKFLQFDRISLWPGHNIGLCPLISIIKKIWQCLMGTKS